MTGASPGTAAEGALWDALEASWPPAERQLADGLALRLDAEAAGSRVNSSRLLETGAGPDEARAEAIVEATERFYADSGRRAMLQARPSEETSAKLQALAKGGGASVVDTLSAEDPVLSDPLSRTLARRGFQPFDPCLLMAGPIDQVLATTEASAKQWVLRLETPLAASTALWLAGGVGAERLAIMARAREAGTPCGVLAVRLKDRIGGLVFWAAHGGIAFAHALHLDETMRRQGGASGLMRVAAQDAAEAGAQQLAVSVRIGNAPAQALFHRCGLTPVSAYVYWRL